MGGDGGPIGVNANAAFNEGFGLSSTGLADSRVVRSDLKLVSHVISQAKVQTGPGEPRWSGKYALLSWTGTVEPGESISLIILPPLASSFIHFLCVILTALLAFKVTASGFSKIWTLSSILKPKAAVVAVAASFCLLCPASSPAAEFPSEGVLKELETRLTAPPRCAPVCAAMEKGSLIIDDKKLVMQLDVNSAANVYITLPASSQSWLPRSVLLDGAAARALRSGTSGSLEIPLSPGHHRIVMEGAVPRQDFALTFDMETLNFDLKSSGWSVSGLSEGRIPGKSLQFTRQIERAQVLKQSKRLLPDPIAPFVILKREIELSNQWHIHTTIQRVAPAVGAINLDVPVLPGESIITAGFTAEAGRVKAALQAGQQWVKWTSSIKPSATIKLTADTSTRWAQEWSLKASIKWHVELEGIPGIKQDMAARNVTPVWRPWPGETLTIKISRPQAVAGPTKTYESVSLKYIPGKRSGHVSFTARILSSQGGPETIILPPGAVLENVKVDSRELAVSQQDSIIVVPLKPGSQTLEVAWKHKTGISIITPTPHPVIVGDLANIDLDFTLPRDRWLLMAGGPSQGPAILIWGIMGTLLLLSVFLGYSSLTPLKGWQWFLLFIGVCTTSPYLGFPLVLWFMSLQRRRHMDLDKYKNSFNYIQIGLALLTLAALGALLAAVPMSLLSTPDMQVAGNGSSSYYLSWYQDQAFGTFPTAWVLSLPLWVYRTLMLAWSLWLALSLPKWIKWGWVCYNTGALWRVKAVVIETKD